MRLVLPLTGTSLVTVITTQYTHTLSVQNHLTTSLIYTHTPKGGRRRGREEREKERERGEGERDVWIKRHPVSQEMISPLKECSHKQYD